MGAWRNYFTGIVIFIGVMVLLSAVFFGGFNEMGLGKITGIPPIWAIIVFFVFVVVILQNPKLVSRLIKKLFRKKGDKNEPKGIFSLKTLIIYGITFTIGFWVSTLILPFIQITNLFGIYLFTGLCLELSAKVCQMFLHNKLKITLDKWFVLWVLIHSVVIYGVLYLINKVTISNQYLFFLAVGFAVAIITHLIWRVMYKK